MTTTYRAASSMGTPTRRAPISSGRVAPGRRLGRRSDRVNTNTAASREAHGPAVPQLRHLPSALDTACRSSATCAASTCSPPGYMAILNRPSRWWSYALRAEDRALPGLAQRADRLPAWTEQRKAGAAAPIDLSLIVTTRCRGADLGQHDRGRMSICTSCMGTTDTRMGSWRGTAYHQGSAATQGRQDDIDPPDPLLPLRRTARTRQHQWPLFTLLVPRPTAPRVSAKGSGRLLERGRPCPSATRPPHGPSDPSLANPPLPWPPSDISRSGRFLSRHEPSSTKPDRERSPRRPP